MSKIQAVRKDALPEALATPGISRYLAFEREDCLVVRSRAEPGAISAWHHRGEHDVYGFILSGSERFEYGPMGQNATVVGPGDFFHIPPHTVHRDVNPSPDQAAESPAASLPSTTAAGPR